MVGLPLIMKKNTSRLRPCVVRREARRPGHGHHPVDGGPPVAGQLEEVPTRATNPAGPPPSPGSRPAPPRPDWFAAELGQARAGELGFGGYACNTPLIGGQTGMHLMISRVKNVERTKSENQSLSDLVDGLDLDSSYICPQPGPPAKVQGTWK